MGYGHRTALLNLTAEKRYYRPIRPEHVAKTGSDETCRRPVGIITEVEEKGLHINLSNTLRRTHNVGGVHSLIRRNHDEFLNVEFHRKIGNILCTENVCENSLRRITLHHRNMFICSCMEHISRMIFLECMLHTLIVGNIAYKQMYFRIRERSLHFKLHVVHRSLGLVQKHNVGGSHARNLTDNFATYRSGSTGNHDSLTTDNALYNGIFRTDRLSSQEVFNPYILNVGRQIWHCLTVDIKFFNLVKHQKLNMISKENVGCTVTHNFQLRRQEQKSVALIVFEHLRHSFRVKRHDWNTVNCAVCVSRRQTQQGNRVKTAFKLALQCRSQEIRIDCRTKNYDSLLELGNAGHSDI